MDESQNYNRIQKAIEFLTLNIKNQPSLDEVAEFVGLSPSHFQRIFTKWAGISPKQFLKYLTLNNAKEILKKSRLSLLDTTYNSGLSSTSRLHDLFVSIEKMTPAEYKNGGQNLIINYSFNTSIFGMYIVASTAKGVCNILFYDLNKEDALNELKLLWPNAKLIYSEENIHKDVNKFLNNTFSNLNKKIKLHLKGTPFQIKVWEALLKIPESHLLTYKDLATLTGNSKASRATGTAIGNNPIAYLIPCHRVITENGKIDKYRWGSVRKKLIVGKEIMSL